MKKTILAITAALILASVMAPTYTYSAGVYVYPRYGSDLYVCGYDAWGYPQYCRSYDYGYPHPYSRYGYPYGYPYYRHHYPYRHWR